MDKTIILNTAVLVALLTLVGSTLGGAVGFFATRSKERSAEWRKHKLDQYKEFMAAASEMVASDTKPARMRLSSVANNIYLVGTTKVVRALNAYLDRKGNDRHDQLLTLLVSAIRRDVGVERIIRRGYRVSLRAPGPDNASG